MTQNSPNLNRNGDATAFANFRTRSKGGLKFKTYFQFNSIQFNSIRFNSIFTSIQFNAIITYARRLPNRSSDKP